MEVVLRPAPPALATMLTAWDLLVEDNPRLALIGALSAANFKGDFLAYEPSR